MERDRGPALQTCQASRDQASCSPIGWLKRKGIRASRIADNRRMLIKSSHDQEYCSSIGWLTQEGKELLKKCYQAAGMLFLLLAENREGIEYHVPFSTKQRGLRAYELNV
jgi:hypothetical protein